MPLLSKSACPLSRALGVSSKNIVRMFDVAAEILDLAQHQMFHLMHRLKKTGGQVRRRAAADAPDLAAIGDIALSILLMAAAAFIDRDYSADHEQHPGQEIQPFADAMLGEQPE